MQIVPSENSISILQKPWIQPLTAIHLDRFCDVDTGHTIPSMAGPCHAIRAEQRISLVKIRQTVVGSYNNLKTKTNAACNRSSHLIPFLSIYAGINMDMMIMMMGMHAVCLSVRLRRHIQTRVDKDKTGKCRLTAPDKTGNDTKRRRGPDRGTSL